MIISYPKIPNRPSMALNDYEKKENEKYFDWSLKNIKNGGHYCWIDYQMMIAIQDNKFVCSPKQSKIMIQHVSPQWFKSNVIVK